VAIRVLVGLALLVAIARPARGDEPPPASTITEWPPKPKPPPALPPPAAPPAPPAPAASPAKEEPKKKAAAEAPAKAPNVQIVPAPGAPGPSGMQVIDVPKGQSVEAVALPKTLVTSAQPGLGERITELKIKDNSRTSAVTIEYLAGVHVGDVLTIALVEDARTRLLSVGLFRDVNIFWEAPSDGVGVRLVISAKDKLSWIVAPTFTYSPPNYGGGLGYAESNALGHNKKFLVYGEYTTAEKLLLAAWVDPQIRDSRFFYSIDLLLRRDSIAEYAAGRLGDPRIERQTDVDTIGGRMQIGVNITRRLHFDVRLKLYYDQVHGSTCYNTTNSDGSGTPDVVAEQGGVCRRPSGSSWDNTLTTTVVYDSRSRVYGVQDGWLMALSWQYGAEWLGTKNNYHLIDFQGVYAKKFFQEHNLLLKLGADVEIDPPFKMEVEAGGAQMRGFLYRQFRGDTAVRLTVEYIAPVFTVAGLAVRAIGFYDSNLTWFRDLPQNGPLGRLEVRDRAFRDFLPDTPSGVVRDSWHNGLGAGVRLYLKGVVLPLVGVDFAYGLESESFQIYFALGTMLE
jgi:outer membrane protein assembly factor BamA